MYLQLNRFGNLHPFSPFGYRSRKAFEHGASKTWSEILPVNEQRSDDMLRYLMHARNANEHGIEKVLDARASEVGVYVKPGTSVPVKQMTIDTRGQTPIVTLDDAATAHVAHND